MIVFNVLLRVGNSARTAAVIRRGLAASLADWPEGAPPPPDVGGCEQARIVARLRMVARRTMTSIDGKRMLLRRTRMLAAVRRGNGHVRPGATHARSRSL